MKQFKVFLTVLLALTMVLCMCACGGNDTETSNSSGTSQETSNTTSTTQSAEESKEESSEPENEAAFKVNVVDGDGNPVSGAMVQICKDTCVFAETDENGVASFNAEITDGYKLSVLSCPEGYEYTGEAEIPLESGITEYTVELTKGN